MDAMDNLVARTDFKGKIYLQYERQVLVSEQRTAKRAFWQCKYGLDVSRGPGLGPE